jgi:RNA polymerase sigma-70 factor (ECF subfamily)
MTEQWKPVDREYNEEDLVRAAQKGDRESFAQLYEANVDKVYRYLVVRMGQSADAEDITAEVFIRAMEKLSSYKPKGVPFVAWLIRIAHNLAVNQFKKSARRKEMPLLDEHVSSDDPAEAAIRSDANKKVSRSLEALTELQRRVVHLRFGAGLSIQETAKVIKRSEGAVKNLQHKALRALRQALPGREVLGYEG